MVCLSYLTLTESYNYCCFWPEYNISHFLFTHVIFIYNMSLSISLSLSILFYALLSFYVSFILLLHITFPLHSTNFSYTQVKFHYPSPETPPHSLSPSSPRSYFFFPSRITSFLPPINLHLSPLPPPPLPDSLSYSLTSLSF